MTEASQKIEVGIAGTTGMVGQRFVERLHNHPFFTISALAASDRSSGKTYGEAAPWLLDSELPPEVASMELLTLDELAESKTRVILSALPNDTARNVETELAISGKAVFTNASSHRMDKNVPLLIPEVNPDHLSLVNQQDSSGFIVANGNCGSIILTLALAPLHQRFDLEEINVFTEQALSGAGYPGVASLDIVDNVLPYIKDEEDKLEVEPAKMLGTATDRADFSVIATTTRVNVREGHLITCHAILGEAVELDEIYAVLEDFRGSSEIQGLPSAPDRPIHVFSEPNRPQPRLDRNIENGMAVSVGRIRQAGKLGNRAVQFVVLGHNTLRGGAGQSILNAELAYSRGLLSE